jgi:hypothetical protein
VRHRVHPDAAELRALLDGELGRLRSWSGRRHLRRCRSCADRLAELAELDRRSAALLRRAGPAVDASEGWRRLAVTSGAARPARPPDGPRRADRRAAVAAAVSAAGLAAVILLRPPGDGEGPAGSPDEAAHQDLCCWDLDGDGPPDDGVFAVVLPGEQLVAVTIYEDGNGNRSLSGRDPIRYASSQAAPDPWSAAGWPAAPDGGAPDVRDVCCADHDLGGPADDGILTVSAGDGIRRVLVYEDLDGSRSFSPGDVLRWNGGRPAPAAAARPAGGS